ncbi:PucR family transcriptional regulator [Streptomyces yaizuensis]|uniref:Helix-turn-helix domain-containing protein n=1 Tax=Streptomyces yaizuensis TaxID=2989713 RepID=A0ABQ5NSX0_9ACTN|nr:helix-turn-helix domain-containing protein [Streptomyces sp. YSPA8]GLF93264.1 helix-turn-helix domain-containing protein [Streptomyces sp. YSPA8]
MTGRLIDGGGDLGEATRALLGALRPDGAAALAAAVVHPLLLAEAVSRAGRAPAGWAVETSAALREEVARHSRAAGPVELPSGARFVEAVALWAVIALHDGPQPPGALLTEVDRITGECAQLGLGSDVVLRYLRLVHAGLSSAFFGRCTGSVGAADQPAVMRELSARLFDAVEAVACAVAERWGEARDRWLSGADARRSALVREILSGTGLPPAASLTARLGYDLTRRHLALVLWCRDHPGKGCARDPAEWARVLLARAGCPSVLVVPAGPCRLWAWGARSGGVPVPAVTADDTGGVLAAVGLPGRGVPGFRSSHAQACAVERVVRTAGSAPAVYDYPSVELAVLLGDDLGNAAGFVARELGPLAAGGPATSALRTTVKCYLDHERSLSTAARQLHVAKNTVAYRVKKAEHLLGRSLRVRPLRLQVALHLAETLGTAVLAAPDSGHTSPPV